jgi:hypothetical protein
VDFKRQSDTMSDPDTSFNVSHYAKAHGILVTTLRSKLRKAGYRTPYSRDDCEAILGR